MAGAVSSSFVGEIRAYAGPIASLTGVQEPKTGWLLCNGATISQSTYATLFGHCGHAFGADPGGGNFILPNLQSRMAMGKHSTGTFNTKGGTGGTETVTLDYTMLPNHTHTMSTSFTGGHTHTGTTNGIGTNHQHAYFFYYVTFKSSVGGNTVYTFIKPSGGSVIHGAENANHGHVINVSAASPGTHTHTVTLNNAGTSGAHNNISPYTLVHWLVKY